MAPIHEDSELNRLRPSKINNRIKSSTYGSTGIKDIIRQHHNLSSDVKGKKMSEASGSPRMPEASISRNIGK